MNTFATTAELRHNAGVTGGDSSSNSGEARASWRERRLKTDVKKSHCKKSRLHSQLQLLNRFSWQPCTVEFGCTMQSQVPMTKGQSCFKHPLQVNNKLTLYFSKFFLCLKTLNVFLKQRWGSEQSVRHQTAKVHYRHTPACESDLLLHSDLPLCL